MVKGTKGDNRVPVRQRKGGAIGDMGNSAREIPALKARLVALDRERSEIAERLTGLEREAREEEAIQPIHGSAMRSTS